MKRRILGIAVVTGGTALVALGLLTPEQVAIVGNGL